VRHMLGYQQKHRARSAGTPREDASGRTPGIEVSGTGARLAAGCVLLSVAAVSCASPVPGGGAPGTGGQGSVSVQQPSPTATVTPVRMTGSPTPEPTGPVPVLKGCSSGTVAISYPGQGDWTVCIRAGARLRLTLPDDGYGSWAPLQVTPTGAAVVASTTDSKGNVRAIVTPTGTAPFCLGTDLRPASPTAPDFPWHLCVSIQH